MYARSHQYQQTEIDYRLLGQRRLRKKITSSFRRTCVFNRTQRNLFSIHRTMVAVTTAIRGICPDPVGENHRQMGVGTPLRTPPRRPYKKFHRIVAQKPQVSLPQPYIKAPTRRVHPLPSLRRRTRFPPSCPGHPTRLQRTNAYQIPRYRERSSRHIHQ